MTETNAGARHRAARRPTTPLSAFGHAITGPMARRTAVAAASSGVILTLSASASIAAPSHDLAPITMASLTAASGGEADVTISQPVTVAADAEWSFATAVATSEAPPPPPAPAPVVERRTNQQASRASDRTDTEAAPEQDATTTVAAPAASGNAIVDIAFRYVGTPYVYGGTTPAGFDCSGFTQYVYAQVGISLPRTSSAQSGAGTRVSAAEARPGDLVWWPGHIGIYLGGNQHIAARSPGTPLHAGEIWNSNPIFIRVS